MAFWTTRLLLALIVILMATAATEFVKLPCHTFNNESTTVECSMYETTGACDLTKSLQSSFNPPDQEVRDLTVKVKSLADHPNPKPGFLESPERNYIEVTWKSPNYLALNKTTGYKFVLEKFGSGPEVDIQLCRYFEVRSTSDTVLPSDAESAVFGYRSGYVSPGSYRVSVHTYPKPGATIPTPVIVSIRTSDDYFTGVFTASPPVTQPTIPPTTQPPPLDTTIHVHTTPYTASVRFERALPGDTRYNHTKYLLNLYRGTRWGRAVDITGAQIPEQNYDKTEIGEATTVRFTYTNLIPGTYTVRVFDYHYAAGAGCLLGCQKEDDSTRYSQTFAVSGADYEPPEPPVLSVDAMRSEATITFYIAPSALLIDYYTPVLRNKQGKQLQGEIFKPTQEDVHVIYTLKTIRRFPDLMEHFSWGDEVTVEMLPTAISGLCSGEEFKYNINGTCVPFTVHKSNSDNLTIPVVTLSPGASNDGSTGNPDYGGHVPVNAVATIVTAVVVVVLAAIGVFLYVRRRQHAACSVLKDICNWDRRSSHDLENSSHDQDSIAGGSLFPTFISKADPISVCVAYVPTPAYDKFAEELRLVLQTYFNCNVELYTGGIERSSLQRQCVIVLHSEALYQLYEVHYHQDSVSRSHRPSLTAADGTQSIRQKDMAASRVLDILQKPTKIQHGQAILLLTFDHLPSRHSDMLAVSSSGTRIANVFCVPSGLKDMTIQMHTPLANGNMANIECPAWDSYAKSSQKSALEAAIKDISLEPSDRSDSAYESGSIATFATVATKSLPMKDESGVPEERFLTVTPHSAEMVYLPTNNGGGDAPVTPGSNPENPLINQQPTLDGDGMLRGENRRENDNNTYLSVAPSEDGTSYECSNFLPSDHSLDQFYQAEFNVGAAAGLYDNSSSVRTVRDTSLATVTESVDC